MRRVFDGRVGWVEVRGTNRRRHSAGVLPDQHIVDRDTSERRFLARRYRLMRVAW